MQIKAQAVWNFGNANILVLPKDHKLGIHSQPVIDYIICTKNQYENQKEKIELNMKEVYGVLFIDTMEFVKVIKN